MDLPPAGPPGPPPFRYQPSREPAVEGAAFSTPFKLLITAVVGGCILWAARLWLQGKLGTGLSVNLGWFVAGLVMLAWTWWAVVRSVTRIAPDELRQSWIWTRRIATRDLAYAKLIRVRGLEWLVAPRLYVRTLLGKFAVFYVSDRQLLAESERLVAQLRAFRNFG